MGNGQCASGVGEEKVSFADCDLTDLDTQFLWQDQVQTKTIKGISGGGSRATGVILTYDGKVYIVPKKGNQQLKKYPLTNKGIYKKSAWANSGSQLYFANKDWTFSWKKPSKTEGVTMEKVILNAKGEYENSLIEKIYVIGKD